MTNEDFYSYYLAAQREGHEIYIGDGVALVMYEDESFGIGSLRPLAGLPSVVFCDNEFTQAFLEDLVKIRKEEHRKGIQNSLTKTLRSIYRDLAMWHEEQGARMIANLTDEDFYTDNSGMEQLELFPENNLTS